VEESERAAVGSALVELAGTFDSEMLTQALDDFGWEDLVRSEPAVAVASVFLAQGRAGSWSSALHDLLIEAAPLDNQDLTGAAVLVPTPGSDTTVGPGPGRLDGLLIGARSGLPSVIAVGGGGDGMRVLRLPRDELDVKPVTGLDPQLPVLRVGGEIRGAEVLAEGETVRRWWAKTIASGRRAVAFELCGAMEAMLELAVTHAGDRHQFGRPVGAFQAIRHRLAECRVAISGAHAAASASLEGEEVVLSAMAAKVVAGRAQKLVGAHCQQVLAGIGFTAEHPFHRYLLRATVMDRVFGSAVELAPQLGRALIARGGPFRMADL
jgi:hypothetical protein